MDTETKTDFDFKVKVGQFEGPLEFLLELIEKRKLHISDVSLSQVADEFINYVQSFGKFPIADSADFILVASTLLLIKSKSLLPNLSLTEEEQGSIEDLEKRLADYKKYKELAVGIEKLFGNFLYFAKEKQTQTRQIFFSPTTDITLSALKKALTEVLKNSPKKVVDLPKITVKKIINLEEMIEQLSVRIEKNLKSSFNDFAGVGRMEKVNVIVSFLAMLELVKRGLVRVNQSEHFKDIEMEGENLNIPTYN
jgi:segregation and condensation protein A